MPPCAARGSLLPAGRGGPPDSAQLAKRARFSGDILGPAKRAAPPSAAPRPLGLAAEVPTRGSPPRPSSGRSGPQPPSGHGKISPTPWRPSPSGTRSCTPRARLSSSAALACASDVAPSRRRRRERSSLFAEAAPHPFTKYIKEVLGHITFGLTTRCGVPWTLVGSVSWAPLQHAQKGD